MCHCGVRSEASLASLDHRAHGGDRAPVDTASLPSDADGSFAPWSPVMEAGDIPPGSLAAHRRPHHDPLRSQRPGRGARRHAFGSYAMRERSALRRARSRCASPAPRADGTGGCHHGIVWVPPWALASWVAAENLRGVVASSLPAAVRSPQTRSWLEPPVERRTTELRHRLQPEEKARTRGASERPVAVVGEPPCRDLRPEKVGWPA